MERWAVACDFDGTIVEADVVDVLLARFGRAGWEQLERDWRAGRIGSRECMRGQVALLDMGRDQLDACLDGCRIDPAFAGFVALTHALGVPVIVASDGADYAIHVVLARSGLDALPVVANHLRQVSAQGWELTFPHRTGRCRSGTCKCDAMERIRMTGRRVVLIGDGASDFCAAEHADFVFAKHELADYCRTHDIAHAAVVDFDGVVELLPRLLAGGMADEPAGLARATVP